MTKRFHTFFVVFWFQKDEKSPKKCEPTKKPAVFFFPQPQRTTKRRHDFG